MNKTLLTTLSLLTVLAAPRLYSQAAPTVIVPPIQAGPSLGAPQLGGTLNYSLGASETVLVGANGNNGTTSSTNIIGTASLITASERHPTSLLYSGGYLFSNTSGQPSGTFQNFGVSQVLATRKWTLVAADFVSYLPSSPTTGFSGVAGVGDIGTIPVNPIGSQSVLSYYSTRITNTASGSAELKITGSTSVEASGSYTIQRFLSDIGIDNSQAMATVGMQHRIDARDSVGVNYVFSRFNYGASPLYNQGNLSFNSQGVNATFERALSKRFSMDLSAGPQWTSSSSVSGVIPARLSASVSAALNYRGERTQASLAYYQGVNAGSGVLLGATTDNVGFVVQRQLDRNWSGSLSGNYAHTAGLLTSTLPQPGTDSFYGGVQVSRRLGRNFSSYLSYTAQTQNVSGVSSTLNAYNGVTHVIGVGITFAPSSIHVGRH
ncbi:hypothetical protein [Terriglobus saanensis]|uniref:Uncharacterized protein n=1 Tax=Terriglobus saanensis (strain ATCC BAA-1853 / DSM 23119 / SP1PR4) TaxID=401053 RepID=E8V407_TERSS|nr:hypothetical protein [Terriglobus saanensis]ADV81421.1 hypothetical protein AciPR4_0586 [Terriglobus saanensis SP1PR4]